jgi:predicted enzyme related to lactoylglutathione lyase
MLDLNSIMIGSMQPKVLSKFYEKVFDKKPDMDDGGFTGWQVGSCFIGVGEHSEMKGKSKEGGRVMFNLATKEVKKEFERISKIEGVRVVKEPYEMSSGGSDGGSATIATLADPDDNFFQLMTPWEA